ncbi:MAG TPA: RnfABCDGE type electron transport complex subunit D [Clostridiales bacterium]|nr:RnfABCDGE type electron transport complex subunit D [Clostridiales bacterium]
MAEQPQLKIHPEQSNVLLFFKTLLRKQPMMRRVLISLIPILLFSIYSFGWRVLSLLLLVTAAGVATEYFFEKSRNSKPTESILVTCFLYTLILPVTIPYFIAVIGIIFAVIFGKQVFGGFARNVFNPAVLGRVFIFVTFPNYMTNNWAEPFRGFPGGFAGWMPKAVDGISSATPLSAVSQGSALPYSHLQLIIGNIPGSIGETSAILILLAGIYLIARKTASWKTIVSVLAGVLGMEVILYLAGVSRIPDPLFAILSGGVLFGTVFMATDPVTSPSSDQAKLAYGVLVGITSVVIREFSLFPEGMMFAILIMNSFVPLLDFVFKSLKREPVQRRVAV